MNDDYDGCVVEGDAAACEDDDGVCDAALLYNDAPDGDWAPLKPLWQLNLLEAKLHSCTARQVQGRAASDRSPVAVVMNAVDNTRFH